MTRSSKTKKIDQFGSSEPLAVHELYNIVVPKGSGVVNYLGAQFCIFSNEQPTQPVQPIQINGVGSSPLGDVLEVEFL